MKSHKRAWDIVHAFEEKDRASLYKKLDSRAVYKIYAGLYELASHSIDKRYFNEINKDKIKSIARVHAIFNKVKA